MWSLRWVLTRFLLPLVGPALLFLCRWGKESLASVIFTPMVYLVIGMYLSWLERPVAPAPGKGKPFARLIRNWHALDLFAQFLLMFFEGAMAAMAQARVTSWPAYLGVFGFLYVPYCLLSVGARVYLLRAKRALGCIDHQQGIASSRGSPLSGRGPEDRMRE